jgi:exodeoxyribonuclease-1
MLFRYRARNWPHTLSEAEQKRWRLHCGDYFSRRLPDYVPRLEALAGRIRVTNGTLRS